MWLQLNVNFSFSSLNGGLHKLPLSVAGLALMASFTTVNAEVEQDGLGPRIEIPETSGKSCVLPEDEMRRRHPDLLKHDRILTLREGVRSKVDGHQLDGSIKQCINCHAIKDDNDQYVRIDNDRHFCVSCHKYAAVTIDCFQCHRDIPEGSSNFHALSGHKNTDFTSVTPGSYGLSVQDMANIAPEVRTDDK